MDKRLFPVKTCPIPPPYGTNVDIITIIGKELRCHNVHNVFVNTAMKRDILLNLSHLIYFGYLNFMTSKQVVPCHLLLEGSVYIIAHDPENNYLKRLP